MTGARKDDHVHGEPEGEGAVVSVGGTVFLRMDDAFPWPRGFLKTWSEVVSEGGTA